MFIFANVSRALPRLWLSALLVLACVGATLAQTNSFTYQGRLNDGGAPANGTYEVQFELWDAIAGGTQQPQPVPITITLPNVQVTNGLFTVPPLDFGATAFPGEDRYLEISVRRNTGDPFTTLSPRQQITSTPYAIRSLSAASATNATQLGGVDAERFVQSDVDGNVNIAGGLTVGGSFSLDIVNAQTQYNLGGQAILRVAGMNEPLGESLFIGRGAGSNASSTVGLNTFVGTNAGSANTTGFRNAFFGSNAGLHNTTGQANSFFGDGAGANNQTGSSNAAFGYVAGWSNTGSDNSFFGRGAGFSNQSGSSNSFFGREAGAENVTGANNAFFGQSAGQRNTTDGNSFFGAHAGENNTDGAFNAFFGNSAGGTNVTGINNSFFGHSAGFANTTASNNSFFGTGAGQSNTTGGLNTFVGTFAGGANNTGSFNSFIGTNAGRTNTTGDNNSFFGDASGFANVSGGDNSFFGRLAGFNNTSNGNSFFGTLAGLNNTTGSLNTLVGAHADLGGVNLTNASAIGANAFVSTSNSMVLGSINGVNGSTASTNVGMGTTSPVTRLHVVGSSWFQGDNTPLPATAGKGIVMGFSGDLGYISSFDYGSFTPKTLLLNNSGGNVGIGTNTPQTSLQVKTASGLYGFTHTDDVITVGSYIGGSQSGAFGGWLGTVSNHPLYFFINGGQPNITVDTTGNVGVGANVPKAKLEVMGGNILLGSPGQGIILKSPNGATCRLLSIDNAGTLVTAVTPCP